MKVLHVIPAIARRYGGPSIAIVQMVRSLRATGVEAEILTTDADGGERMQVPLGVTSVYEGVPVTFFRRVGPDAPKLSPGLGRWVRRNVRQYDLVHIHSVFAAPSVVAGRWARHEGIPYVVRPLGHLARWSLSQKPVRKRLFLTAWGAKLVRGATAIHYTAFGEMEDARAVVGEVPGFVVPLGLTCDRADARKADGAFRPSVPGLGRAPFVLFLGRIHPKKGIEPLVEGFARATAGSKDREWALVLAGDGDPAYVRALRTLTDRHVPGRAFWMGWLEGERKLAAMAEAELFALVSSQENFGISAFEAMAEGTPSLLGSGVDLAGDVASAGAGWNTEPNAAAVEAALREILPAREEQERRGQIAAEFVRTRFSWPAVTARLIDEYEKILERRERAVPNSQEPSSGRARALLQEQG